MSPVLGLLLAAGLAFAQPAFDAARIVRSGATEPEPLQPSKWYSIYGSRLASEQACTGQVNTSRDYPTEVCGVRVALNGTFAQMNLVSPEQINFLTPDNLAAVGPVELRYSFGGTVRIVMLPVGLPPVTLSLGSAAAVGLPVWLNVKVPNRRIQFPVKNYPELWGCHNVELRRDGQPVPRIAYTHMIVSSGPTCGEAGLPGQPSKTGRLPLHLLYRFETPGTYEVRYQLSIPTGNPGGPAAKAWIESEWMRFNVGAGAPDFRDWWLDRTIAPSSAVELLTDYLPSIGGFTDERTRALLRSYLQHEDAFVRSFAGNLLN